MGKTLTSFTCLEGILFAFLPSPQAFTHILPPLHVITSLGKTGSLQHIVCWEKDRQTPQSVWWFETGHGAAACRFELEGRSL